MALAPLGSYALLFASMSLVGVYVALTKPLVAVFPIFLLALLRFAIAAVSMIPVTRAPRSAAALDRRTVALILVQSFFGNFLFSICMLYGMSMTGAVAAGVVLACIPAAVGLLSWIVLREPLTRRLLLAIALTVTGVALLAVVRAPEGSGSAYSLLGLLLLAGAVLCEAVYVVVGKRLTARLSPMRISALINLAGLLFILPFGLWQLQGFDFGTVSFGSWGLLVFYSLSASVFSVWLWMKGLQKVPAGQSGVFTIALPLAATLVGVFVLGEVFTILHGLAMVLALSGVLLVLWPAPGHRRNRYSP